MEPVGEIELRYGSDVGGSRVLLRWIGKLEVRYEHNLAVTVGEWPILRTPSEGRPIARIGDRRFGRRILRQGPEQDGQWRVRRSAIGGFLAQVGPFLVDYRGPLLCVSRVGPATFRYEPGRRLPSAIVVDRPEAGLGDDLRMAIAYVLLDRPRSPSAKDRAAAVAVAAEPTDDLPDDLPVDAPESPSDE